MKTKNYLIVILLLCSFTMNSQSKKNKKAKINWETFYMKDSKNQLQFITNYMQARVDFYRFDKILNTDTNNNQDFYQETKRMPIEGLGSKPVIRVFYDGLEVLGEGINRLYTLERLRVRDFERMEVNRQLSDKRIFLYSKEK